MYTDGRSTAPTLNVPLHSVVLFLLTWVGQCCTLGRCVVLWLWWSSVWRFPVMLDGRFPRPLWNQQEGLSEVWALARGQEAVISMGHNHIHRLQKKHCFSLKVFSFLHFVNYLRADLLTSVLLEMISIEIYACDYCIFLNRIGKMFSAQSYRCCCASVR